MLLELLPDVREEVAEVGVLVLRRRAVRAPPLARVVQVAGEQRRHYRPRCLAGPHLLTS